MVYDLKEKLSGNSYPGRGIIIGKSPNGKYATIAYFIMGRSVNSRNRIFTATEDGIQTEAYDASKMVDPSLIIYHPVRMFGNTIIVTNGDQTDTAADFIKAGSSFEAAMETRCFEPDEPNYTPRISGIVETDGDFTYKLSILKSSDGTGVGCNRFTFAYSPVSGLGHFVHTYDGDGSPLPSFSGEPEPVNTFDDIDEYTSVVWDNLNEDNKVSLYVCYRDLETGETSSRIVNKFN